MNEVPAGLEAAGYLGALLAIWLLVMLYQSVTEWAAAREKRIRNERLSR